ncbi:MAG: M16 family metallopeptidase [Alphaproteobacteria bacterium]
MLKFVLLMLVALVFVSTSNAQLLKELEQDRFAEAYLIKTDTSDDITINLVILSGEFDNKGAEGMAHFVEHLAWYNAFPQVDNTFTGHNNAWTYRETTHFKYRTQRVNMDKALNQLNGIFKPLSVSEEFVAGEIGVVLREADFRANDFGVHPSWLAISSKLHGKAALARNVLGSRSNIKNFTYAKAKAYHQQFYKPSNTILTITGNLTDLEAVAYLNASNLGVVSAPEEPTQQTSNFDAGVALTYDPLPDEAFALELEDDREAAQDRLLYSKVFKVDRKEDILQWVVQAEIAQGILNSAMDGGLLKPLHFSEFLAGSVSVNMYPLDKSNMSLSISLLPDKDVGLDELATALEKELERLGTASLDVNTFLRVKNRRLSYYGYYWNTASFEESTMLSMTSFRRKPKPMYDIYDDVELVEYDDFQQLWGKIFGEGRVVISKLRRPENLSAKSAEEVGK